MQDLFINSDLVGILAVIISAIILTMLRQILNRSLNERRTVKLQYKYDNKQIEVDVVKVEEERNEEYNNKIKQSPQLLELGRDNRWELWKPDLKAIVKEYSKLPKEVIITKLDMDEKLILSVLIPTMLGFILVVFDRTREFLTFSSVSETVIILLPLFGLLFIAIYIFSRFFLNTISVKKQIAHFLFHDP